MTKILTFTDIHFGENLNSPLKIEIAKKNIDWIKTLVIEHKIKTIIFCGDWFHSRNSISVFTFYQSYIALVELAKCVDKLYMIVGNHDSYYKNTIETHSLKAFEQIPNVEIVETMRKLKINDKELVLAPWGTPLDGLCSKQYDFLFGHFEPNGADLGGSISRGSEYSIDDLTKISPNVYSGHYHLSKIYPTEFGKLIMIGSPSQQNWGDVGHTRGCYIIDIDSTKSKFIENVSAPKHNLVFYSHILETKKLPKKDEISNNFVKFVVDCPYKYSQINNILDKLQKANPLSLETEYYYSEQGKLDLQKPEDSIKTHEEYISICVEQMELPNNINKEKLLEMALNIYKTVSTEG